MLHGRARGLTSGDTDAAIESNAPVALIGHPLVALQVEFFLVPNLLRRWWPGMVSGAVSIAIHIVRLAPELSLRKTQGYDDFAYFGGAQALAEGHMPYRTIPFVQPPGTMLIGLPAAFIGRILGGDIGIAALRIMVFLLAALTCALIADLLRPHGIIASLAGSLFFATCVFSALPSQTFYLEPFIAFALVFSFWLLRYRRTRLLHYFFIGGVLGIAITIKAWAIVDIFVIGAFLLARHGRKEAATWVGGVAATATLICLPFFILAPTAMWNQVVISQLSRVGSSSLSSRLAGLNAFTGLPGWAVKLDPIHAQLLGGAVVVLALVPVIVQLVHEIHPSKWENSTWWSIAAIPQLALLAYAPVFSLHYLSWPAAMLSLGVGRSAGLATRQWTTVVAAVLIGVVVLASTTTTLRSPKFAFMPPVSQTRLFARSHRCTWFAQVELQSLSVARGVPFWAPCRTWPDPIGVGIISDPSHRFGSASTDATHLDRWQTALQSQLQKADSAVTCGAPGNGWFSPETSRDFVARFQQVGSVPYGSSRCDFWEVRASSD